MNRILRLCLPKPVFNSLAQRYQRYEQDGATRFSAGLFCLLNALGWLFLRFESPAWQPIRQNHQVWFPHISPNRPRLGDPLRYLLQSVWLLAVYPFNQSVPRRHPLIIWYRKMLHSYQQWLATLPQRLFVQNLGKKSARALDRAPPFSRKALLWFMTIFSMGLALLCISQPFDLQAQLIFVLVLWMIGLIVRRVPGRVPALMMIVLSLTISSRYIWWRYSSTLNWDDPLSLTLGALLLVAETYAWIVLILGYVQTVWPLNRMPVALPGTPDTWPTVDIMVPTYNEDLSVVKPTIYAALGVDWPKDKLNIYLLDDGNRSQFKDFAQEVGVHYISRPTHEHAKAGNINHALKNHAKGEFVAIFDCDHVPTRSFLQLTMGWFFKDKKLAIIQTPHHFFSPDPFERNLGRFGQTPNEGTLFYGLVQDGNDMWNAAFFCGSCAVIRRAPLDEVGGIAVETVTEDAHTSLRLHRKGYNSAYIRIPQAAGLATESLSAHIGQRIRWARGMVQIFRVDNPLLGKGLKLNQRLCYVNAMLHFLSGVPRLIFLTAPLAFLLLHRYIIYAPGLAIVLYVLPHMIQANLTNSRIQGRYRHSFWGEIYETVLAWYIARPTTVALFNPKIGKFNVTAKGGLMEKTNVDWVIGRPYMLLIVLNIAGVIAGIWRMFYGPASELPVLALSMVWVLYNLVILGGAIAVSIEARQLRRTHRVEISMPAVIACKNGHLYPCTLRDYSDGGVGIELKGTNILQIGEQITLLLRRGKQEYPFPAVVMRSFGQKVGIRLEKLSVEQHIEFIQCTFARADAWALTQDGFAQEKPIESMAEVLHLGFRGFQGMALYAPRPLGKVIHAINLCILWVVSIIPHPVKQNLATTSQNITLTQ